MAGQSRNDHTTPTSPQPAGDVGSTGQVEAAAAEVYEQFFVPALFGQWPETVLGVAGVGPGHDVLDVGCGTGVLARAAAERTGEHGTTVGADVNEDMLEVARSRSDRVVWRALAAEDLRFPDDSFDHVVSQFAMMFFVDPALATAEMARVARPEGTVTVATWAAVEHSPGYAALVELIDRLFGAEAAGALLAPFTLGTDERLLEAMAPVLPEAVVTRHEGQARFESLDAWLFTDVRGWTLSSMIDDDGYRDLLAAGRSELGRFVDDQGQVRFPAPALIATATV